MLRRQERDGYFRIERVPLTEEPIVLGVVLNGTFFPRFGQRFRYEGNEYQLECPSATDTPLRLVQRRGDRVIELSPTTAEEHLKTGRLQPLG